MAEGVKLLWPLGNTRMGRETLLSDFGAEEPWRNFPHTGIDIGRYGEPVLAAHDGVVAGVYMNLTWNGYGLVLRNYDTGVATYYLHMAAPPLFVMGDLVVAGQEIGRVGATNGRTRDMAAHLHFAYEGPDANNMFDDPWPHLVARIEKEEPVSNGTITDLTGLWEGNYDTSRLWDRPLSWVKAAVVHHTAGWYGPKLGPDATLDEEIEQLHAMAKDHRNRFGIGPAYHYAVFPSGRVYAIGKAGTRRAHTKGRTAYPSLMPMGQMYPTWNDIAVGVVVFGDYEERAPTVQALRGLDTAIADIRRWSKKPQLPVFFHGTTPTVNSNGEGFEQGTQCPGRHLLSALASRGMLLETPEEVTEQMRIAEEVGYTRGYTHAKSVVLKEAGSMSFEEAIADAVLDRLVEALG